jgi:cobalt-precorrin 5A hydrolase
MKIAIITVTENGKKLGETILNELLNDSTIIRVEIFHKNVKTNLNECFDSFNSIIAVMATGIVIRTICPLIKNKGTDPGVLVIDEQGKHVISLLSGHLGGANELAIKIANIINSEPVITTATDINNKYGIDCLANKYYFNINPLSNIKHINSGLINNEKVIIDYNSTYDYLWNDKKVRDNYHRGSNESKSITVSNGPFTLNLIPRDVVVGVGSRKNIDSKTIIKAIKNAMIALNLPLERINCISTGEMKKNEKGIIEAAEQIHVPLKIISEMDLKKYKNPDLNDSEFVMENFGVGGVCEPSSLITAGENSTLILRKTPYNGVTVAVSVSEN